MPKTDTKPVVQLVGRDGNAFAIMGAAQKAARRAGWTPDEINEYLAEAKSSDYDHLLQTTMRYFDVE